MSTVWRHSQRLRQHFSNRSASVCGKCDNRFLLIQQAKKYDKARWAFERAALGQERQSSPWQAGKLIEQAVTCSKETGDLTNLIELTK